MSIAAVKASQLASSSSTIDERRYAIFGCLLRYSPETGALRDRILERLVLSGLLGSSPDNAYRIGRIQENLNVAASLPALRTSVIQATLQRLIADKKATQAENRGRHAYCLTSAGLAEISENVDSMSVLVDRVSMRVLDGISVHVSLGVAQRIFRAGILQVLSTFGHQIAKSVVGYDGRRTELRRQDIRRTIEGSAKALGVTDREAIESLESRFLGFLGSVHPDDQQLRFQLTQGYYFAKLLEYENASFDPIAEHAFRDAVFYLDTNVVVQSILRSGRDTDPLRELVRIARRMGIELRVTRETVNEIRRVAADRRSDLERVFVLPTQLVERSNDEFLAAFLDARLVDPEVDVVSFLAPFDNVSDFLAAEDILLEDICIADGLIDVDKSICAKFDAAALQGRGYGKSPPVASHDAFHYCLVAKLRDSGTRAWFLSRDRTLLDAGRELAGDDVPFSFGLSSFLHSISPFMVTAEEQGVVTNLFSAVLDDLIPASHAAFDLKELSLIVEMHEDVLATPAELLVAALDSVKTNVLKGRVYTARDTSKVALELKKFLSSRVDIERRELLNEADRLRRDLAEMQIRQTAVSERDEELSNARRRNRAAAKRHEVALDSAETRIGEQEVELIAVSASLERARSAFWVAMSVVLIALAAVILIQAPAIALFGSDYLDLDMRFSTAVCRVLAVIVYFIGPAVLLRRMRIGSEVRIVAATVVLAAGLYTSNIFTEERLSNVASLLEVAGVVVVAMFSGLLRPSSRRPLK